MTPALDLTRYWWRKEVHDLMLYATWIYNEDQEDTEPALVILPRYRKGAPPVAIALSSAFKYNSPAYLARAAGIFAQRMGFEPTITNAHRIAMVIDDHIGDLLMMPVDPTQAVQVGEAVVHDGGARKTVGIMDYEQVKA